MRPNRNLRKNITNSLIITSTFG